MIIQFEILQAQADRILAVLPSLGFVYDPANLETEAQQKWTFFLNLTMQGWESEVFNYERSLAIANEPNDSAALQGERYEIISSEILSDKETDWKEAEQLKIGMIRLYDGKRYVTIQDHTTQLGWEPPLVPALFVEKPLPVEGELYPIWIQPLGAQDAYALGARVNHNGSNWESQYNANVWEPGIFGWIII
jgi:hypothetical protein